MDRTISEKYIGYYQNFFADFWNKHIHKYSRNISQLWILSDYYADERTKMILINIQGSFEKCRKLAKASMRFLFN